MLSLLVFNRVYRLELQSIMLVFSTPPCALLPLLSCFVDHILHEFYILFLTRFKTYKNCFTTPNKND
jgi:hypothetical protein